MTCAWCAGGAHSRCLDFVCDCTHQAGPWLHPERRGELRAGAEPASESEAAFQAGYLAHRAERREADARRA